MSDTLPAMVKNFAAFVVGVAFDSAGTAGFAFGDGRLVMVLRAAGDVWAEHQVHEGAAMCLASSAGGFVTGGDDGRLMLTAPGAPPAEIFRMPRKWVEHVAAWGDGKSGLIAASVGRDVHLYGADGIKRREFAHPSTVSGIAFDAKGKRLAASHYNGASLWFTQSSTPSPRLLDWKGSHLGVIIHPAAEAVVTAMQENALHGWRLSDGQHMRMTGYPAKTASLSFSHNGKWLASSGADAVVLWPFFGGGPMGKAPREMGVVENVLVTQVACHPSRDVVAAGYADGAVRLLDINGERELELIKPNASPVSALAWSGDARTLAFGTEAGAVGLLGV